MADEFNQHLIQLIIGLQSTAWMALGKQQNPVTGKQEVNLDLARDSIDTLLMFKEKMKGNLNQAEETILNNSMQDLELNFIDVSKSEQRESKKKSSEEKKEPISSDTKEEQKNSKNSLDIEK